MPYVEPSKASHVFWVGTHMRDADRREVEAVASSGALQAVYRSYRLSTHNWAALTDDGKPFAVFGVAPLSVLSGYGCPWMVATDRIAEARRPFIRQCRDYVGLMLQAYPELRNYVDVRNDVAIRWLKWMGFHFDEPIPFGREGELFYPFSMGASVTTVNRIRSEG